MRISLLFVENSLSNGVCGKIQRRKYLVVLLVSLISIVIASTVAVQLLAQPAKLVARPTSKDEPTTGEALNLKLKLNIKLKV